MRRITFLSTLLLILAIVGSQFVTTLASQFISLEDASQTVTIPYRAFVLLIACFIIVFTFKKRVKVNNVNKVLWVYWGLIILRFIYDMYFRMDVSVNTNRVNQIWLFMICSTFIPMYAITKTYQYVNKKWLFYGTLVLSVITAILIINSVQGYWDVEELEDARLESNVAMGSIITGYFGLLVLILSIYAFTNSSKILLKFLTVFFIIVGILLLFRSGSRGPIFAAMGIILTYLIAKRHSPIVIILTSIILVLIFFFWDYIIITVSNFAPNLYMRLTREEGLLTDRLPIYNSAMDSFMKNPLIGHDFGIYNRGLGSLGYAHNLFLDSLMQLGVIGFTLMVYIVVKLFKLVAHNLRTGQGLVWLNLFLLMKFFMLQLSSAFYLESSFSIIMVYLFQLQLSDNNTISKR